MRNSNKTLRKVADFSKDYSQWILLLEILVEWRRALDSCGKQGKEETLQAYLRNF